jgi:hypothetical protein
MNKTVSLFILSLMVIGMLGVVSARIGASIATDVLGTIYNANDNSPIDGASVTVHCLHNGTSNTGTTTSDAYGYYSVLFDKSKCGLHDSLTVDATKGSLSGSNTGTVTDTVVTWNIGVVNVPLVPEFGVVAGALTILGALGTFFVVRRK